MSWGSFLKSAGSKVAQESGKKIAEKITKKVKEKTSKVKGKDVAKKMLGGGGESSEKGGALVARPSSSIVSSPAGGLVPTKADEGGSLVVKSSTADELGLTPFMQSVSGIKESVKSIKDSLNDNLEDAEKRLEKQRLLNARLDREEQEEELETKKPGIGKKLLKPIKDAGENFLQKLKRFFVNTLLGMLINGLMGGQRDVVVTFLLGYRQYRKVKAAAVKFILKIGSSIKNGLKGAAGQLGKTGKSIFGTLVNVGNKLKAWVAKAIKIVIKGATETVKRTPQIIRTGQRILQKVKPIQRLRDAGSVVNKFRKNPLQTLKSIKDSGIGQRVGGVLNRGKNLFNKAKNFRLPQINWKNIGSGIKDVGIKTFKAAKESGAGQFIGKQANRFKAFATKNITAMQDTANGLIKGGVEKYKAWRKNIEMMTELLGNPSKLFEKAKGFLSGKMDKVMKNNKMWQQLKNLKPKDAAKGIGNMIKNLKKSKEVMGVVKTLKNAKQTMKIPMLDRILALILGVVDYTILGESPINAFGKALGGLLGFSFGTALGSPLGPGAFLVGIAGGIVGEQLANVLSAGLSKVPVPKFGTLGQVPDPIAAATPGMGPRPIVRNPFGKGAEEFDKAQEELSMANLAEGKSGASGTADEISSSASYEEGAEEETVVIDAGGEQGGGQEQAQPGKVEFIDVGLDKETILNSNYQAQTNAVLYKV